MDAMNAIEREERPPSRDFFGLSPEDPSKCKICNGFGIIQCSKCKAKGYV